MRGFVFLLLSSALLAQVPPDPRELLARADAPIFTAKTVRLAATQSTGFAGVAAASPANPFKMEFVRGGRGRAEFLAGNTTITLMVFDGANLWEYHDLGNQYTKRAAPAWIFQGEIATLDYGRNPANIAAASYENEETIDFGGRPVPCYVVRADYRGAPNNRLGKGVVRRVWISKDAEMILRDYWEGPLTPFMGTARMAATTNYTVIETDIPLADELFVFHPPPGSKLGEPIVPGGVIGGVVSGSLAAPPPPPPPPPPKTVEEKPAGTQRINVSAAGVSALSKAAAYSRRREAPRGYFQGWHHSGCPGDQRPPVAHRRRRGSSETLGVPADYDRWRTRRGDDSGRRDIHSRAMSDPRRVERLHHLAAGIGASRNGVTIDTRAGDERML